MSAKVHDSATTVNGHGSHMKLSVQSNGSANHRISGRNGDDEFSEPDEPVEVIENPDDELRRVAPAKERHEADLLVHHYEAPKADRMQDE